VIVVVDDNAEEGEADDVCDSHNSGGTGSTRLE